ncbi:hypothetical protein Hanom_Chr16g01491441 [Helianthus anomalus]
MNPDWWGTPSNTESKYRSTGLSPSWAESPTPPRITVEQWASVTNQKQSEPKMITDLYGNLIQVPVKPAPTTNLYGNPLPPVTSQRHRSTVAPSSLDPRNCSQTKMAFYAKIVKDASNGKSSRNDDSSEHDRSSVEDVSTSVEDVTTSSSSSSEDGTECESSREVVDSDPNESTSESDSSQICVDESISDSCDRCDSKYDVTFIHNQHLIVDLSKCTEVNMFGENYEKEFKKIIETLKQDKTELTKMVSRKQTEINLYINRLELMQKRIGLS